MKKQRTAQQRKKYMDGVIEYHSGLVRLFELKMNTLGDLLPEKPELYREWIEATMLYRHHLGIVTLIGNIKHDFAL